MRHLGLATTVNKGDKNVLLLLGLIGWVCLIAYVKQHLKGTQGYHRKLHTTVQKTRHQL